MEVKNRELREAMKQQEVPKRKKKSACTIT